MTHALIAGGGIAGAVTAMALRKAGISSTVHEAYPTGADDVGAFLVLFGNGLEALRTIGAQQAVVDASFPADIRHVAGPGQDTRRVRARTALGSLAEREREVAVAVGRGQANAEIAAALYMGVPTVKTHVSRILTKLDLNNRVQIALLVHDAGLLDEENSPFDEDAAGPPDGVRES